MDPKARRGQLTSPPVQPTMIPSRDEGSKRRTLERIPNMSKIMKPRSNSETSLAYDSRNSAAAIATVDSVTTLPPAPPRRTPRKEAEAQQASTETALPLPAPFSPPPAPSGVVPHLATLDLLPNVPPASSSSSMKPARSTSSLVLAKSVAASTSQHGLTPTPAGLPKSLSQLDVRVLKRDAAAADVTGQDDGWQSLCLKVLPLFNGEGLKAPIEDLNALVRRCLRDRILTTMYEDVNRLLEQGMLTLSAKLSGAQDEKLVTRLVEIWSFFLGTVLPYFEGVFLPLQSEIKNYSMAQQTMDIRSMTLTSFRDHVIAPILDKLKAAFEPVFDENNAPKQRLLDTAARVLQMASILASVALNDKHPSKIDNSLAELKADLRRIIQTWREYQENAGAVEAR